MTREALGFFPATGSVRASFGELRRKRSAPIPLYLFVAAMSIAGTDGRFQIETDQGQTFASKKILFTVGMEEQPLGIQGLSEVYGKTPSSARIATVGS